MKKIIFLIGVLTGLLLVYPEAMAQDGGKKSKKSKKAKGMGSQEDLDQDFREGKERMMTKEDKRALAQKKKEVAAKRKKDEITRKRSDKVARQRLSKAQKNVSKKKKRWVKTH
jgi:hypothetical protein